MAGTANIKIELTATPGWRDILVTAFEAGFDAGHYHAGEPHECSCKTEALDSFRAKAATVLTSVGACLTEEGDHA